MGDRNSMFSYPFTKIPIYKFVHKIRIKSDKHDMIITHNVILYLQDVLCHLCMPSQQQQQQINKQNKKI